MRPHVCLLLALAALHARAATIPAPAQTNFEKKLAEAVKEVLEKDAELQNVSSEQELIDQTNVVKDIDNKLLKQVGGDAIPVKVVVEEVKPAIKTDEDKKDCDKVDSDDDANIKRVEIDLKHPGEPQRQEHETQNPEHFENEHAAFTTFKKLVNDAQNVFNQGFSDITHGINDLLVDQEPVVSVKQSIDHLHATFMEQMDKLNTTIQGFWKPETVEDKNKQVSVQNVESGLKVLENNFEYGVKSLKSGVEVLTVLKSDFRDDTSGTTEKPSSNPLFPFFQNFQQTIQHGFGNLTSNVQNFFVSQGNNGTAVAAGAQSDDGATQASKPTVWQGIQNTVQGFLNPSGQPPWGTQGDESSAPSGPFAQVIQNNPFVQGVINFIQPKPPQAQPQASQPAPSKPAESTESEGSNVVPTTEDKPADEQKEKPAEAQTAQPAKPQAGPIQQIIQRNPIVQGITGAVNRIQSSITNPEKPREEPAVAEASEKGGFFPYGGYHHGHRPGDEHNNDVDGSGVAKSAAEAEIEKISDEKPEDLPAKEESLKVEKIEEPSPEAPVKQD